MLDLFCIDQYVGLYSPLPMPQNLLHVFDISSRLTFLTLDTIRDAII